ncbi:tRNA lysidine(34) synthetase TilS [Corynebacterium mastitidis]|uniref:tRNA(Ile)-lysidine synthase n=1 Tax=Corynebacterium mastitidis TaxID=161890 RepID=A0A2N0X6R7_9CORY|nr:tRNA lysidine(34) synthetase TilS [Corynebacterium mastitidis]PKF68414.1 tRNA lysidine(34) synthetase TilS [Corynebacterium mastitidis]
MPPRRLGRVDIPRDPPRFLPVRTALRAHTARWLSPGQPVAVGLSGGADSTALLAAALMEGLRAHAVVVDHGLQPGSGEVAARAAALALDLGASAEIRRVRVGRAGGMEAAAREARYRALRQAARGRPLLVGHTRDDQAETYLLAALRGNPAGMLPASGGLHRPLLGVRRADTEGACRELGLEPWRDPQNEDSAFRRVAVRAAVIPTLSEVTGVGDPVSPLAQAADRAALDAEALDQWARRAATDSVADLARLPQAVRGRIVGTMILRAGARVTRAALDAVEALVMDWRGQGPVAVGAGLVVARADGKLTVTREKGVRDAR